jgi:hypothetical protein
MWPGRTAAGIAVILRVFAWHNELVDHPNDIEPGDAERRRLHSHGGPWERVKSPTSIQFRFIQRYWVETRSRKLLGEATMLGFAIGIFELLILVALGGIVLGLVWLVIKLISNKS